MHSTKHATFMSSMARPWLASPQRAPDAAMAADMPSGVMEMTRMTTVSTSETTNMARSRRSVAASLARRPSSKAARLSSGTTSAEKPRPSMVSSTASRETAPGS